MHEQQQLDLFSDRGIAWNKSPLPSAGHTLVPAEIEDEVLITAIPESGLDASTV
jgi:hypothetical protein